MVSLITVEQDELTACPYPVDRCSIVLPILEERFHSFFRISAYNMLLDLCGIIIVVQPKIISVREQLLYAATKNGCTIHTIDEIMRCL